MGRDIPQCKGGLEIRRDEVAHLSSTWYVDDKTHDRDEDVDV